MNTKYFTGTGGPKEVHLTAKVYKPYVFFFLSPKKQAGTNKWKTADAKCQGSSDSHTWEREREMAVDTSSRGRHQITLNFLWSLRVGRAHVSHLEAKLPQLLSTLTPLSGGSRQAAGESQLTSFAGLRVQPYRPIGVPSVQKLQLSRVPLNWPQGPEENCSPLFCSQRQGQVFQSAVSQSADVLSGRWGGAQRANEEGPREHEEGSEKVRGSGPRLVPQGHKGTR